ncbi:helix-turn-helix transcriptional regulator, partial [Streptomyces sp. NPDC007168]
MTEKLSVEALLEEARLNASIPPPAERLRLREAAKLSRAQVAETCDVGRSTVANWETGHSEPAPPARLPYLRLLKGLAEIYPPDSTPTADPAPHPTPAPVPAAFTAAPETLRGPDGRAIEGDPGPCIRCGIETTYQSTDGRPLHSGAMCQPAGPQTAPSSPAAPAPVATSPTPAPVPSRPERRARSAARAQADTTALIARAVQDEAERAGGDEEVALKALIKRAIPDVMHLFNETRATARY